MQPSARQTIGFVAAVAVVSSVLVATSAVALRERQQENAILDLRRKVLMVAGLTAPGASPSALEVTQLFESNIREEVVTLATGEPDPTVDPTTYDQRAATVDPTTSRSAPSNAAKVQRLRHLVEENIDIQLIQDALKS